MCLQQKETGILLAVSSLPSPYGIGDLGPAARACEAFPKILLHLIQQ